MKRFFITLGMMVAATLSLTNCNKEYVETVLPASGEFTINAGFIDTKTANDGMNTTWSEGDTVAVFHAVAGTTDYVLDGKFVTTGDGNFTGTLASALDASKSYDWYMIFPYNEKLKTPAADTIYSYIGNRKSGLIQTGNDSMAHVCGKSFTLVGKTSGVAAATVPALQMKNIASLAAIKVTNSTSSAFTVTKVTLDAVDEDIVGSYFVNYSDIDNVVLTPSADYVTTTSVVNVKDATALAAGESAIYYAAVKPYTAAAGKTIKVKVEAKVGTNDCSYEKEFSISSPVTFSAGKIKTINLPVSDMAVDMKSLPYSETFASELGDFKIENVTIPEGKTFVWKYDTHGYAKASSGVKADSEAWLISPVIDLSSASNAYLSFDHAHKYAGSPSDELTLWVREMGGSWAQLTIPTYSDQKSYTFVSASVDLSAYAGKAVQVAFKYISTSSAYGTWEIKNFLVSGTAPTPAAEFGVSAATIEVAASATSASIGVTGNVAWTATANSDGLSVSPTSGNGEGTVTATFPANTSENVVEYIVTLETAASVETKEIEVTIRQAAYIPEGKDVLTKETTGISVKNTYSNWTTTANTGAEYAANTAATDNAIQMRSTAGCGIVTTKSSGAVYSVNVTWEVTEGDVVRKINVYGRNTPYTSVSDLDNEVYRGTLIGSIEQGVNSSLDLDPKYKYIGIKATDAAVYLTNISILWTNDSGITVKQSQTMSFSAASVSATMGAAFTAPTLTGAKSAVTYKSSNEAIATVDASTGAVTLVAPGKTTISAIAAEDDTYYAAYAEYVLEVNAAEGSGPVEITLSGTMDDNYSFTQGPITVSQAKGSGNSLGNYKSLTGLRIYIGNTLTFTSTKTITKIEFIHTGSNAGGTGISSDVGTYTRGETSSTWTGSSKSVTITNTRGSSDTSNIQLRPTAIKVTYEN